jgi:probable DNA repair protein
MPHATAQLDWLLALAITERIVASAREVHFSYARQKAGVDTRRSRLVSQLAGEPRSLPDEPSASSVPATVIVEDASRVPFAKTTIRGGAAVLTAQSQCPFKAFAIARLGARGWEPAVAGLTPAQRGQLIHTVLHAVWAGPPLGIRTLADLRAVSDLHVFVSAHVERVAGEQIPAGVRERMPRRYLDLEQARLTRLVSQWLEYESSRHAFTVIETEAENGSVVVAGLTLQLRLDRIDELNDGSMLIIDYKTGDVSPSSWDLPRPDDVQLPLYAAFALDPVEQVGGLTFAKVRTGDNKIEFAGRVTDAKSTLSSSLGGTSALVKRKLAPTHLEEWRACIEQLARDFIAGHAEADPRDYPKTCERCELPVLCRIHETREQIEADDTAEGEDASNE